MGMATMDRLTTRSMPVQPASFDPKARSVRAIVATEGFVQVYDWEQGDVVTEVLLASGMELPEGRTQVPLLNCHMRYSVEDQFGSVRDFSVENGTIVGSIFFDSTEAGQNSATKVSEGHLTDLSAGYSVLERYYVPSGQKAFVGDREFEGPVKVCTRWQLREVSLTPIGADSQATFRSRGLEKETDERLTQRIKEILSARETTTQHEGGTTMSDDPKQTAPSAEEVRQAALEAETARMDEIEAMAERHGTSIANITELVKEARKAHTSPAEFWKRIEPLLKKPEPAAATTPDTEPVIEINDFTPPWKRRSAAILQVMTARALGSSRLEEYQKHLREQFAGYGQRAMEQEKREATEIIKSAKLPRVQEERTLSIAGGGSTGEYALPAPFLAELFVIIEQYGMARRYFRPISMTSKTLDLATISSKPTAVWATEATNSTAYDPAFGTGQLSAEKLVGITSWSSELEEDSAIALLPTLQMLMAEAVYTKEDLAGFSGDGTATYGSFTGLVNVATAGVTMGAGLIAFSDITADYLKSVRDALSIAKRRGAMWFMHPDIISLVEGLKDLQGRFIYRGPGDGRPALLWGYPIAGDDGIEAMPGIAATAAATKFVGFGNPQWMLMGNRRGLDIMVSREGILNTAANNISFNALQGDGAILRVTERIAFKGPLGPAFAYLKTATT